MSMQDDNIEQARKYIEKESSLAKLFEMGRYQEIYGFVYSSLYSHMKFKEVDENFIAKIHEDLLKLFRDKETFEYMTGNEEWKAWLK